MICRRGETLTPNEYAVVVLRTVLFDTRQNWQLDVPHRTASKMSDDEYEAIQRRLFQLCERLERVVDRVAKGKAK